MLMKPILRQSNKIFVINLFAIGLFALGLSHCKKKSETSLKIDYGDTTRVTDKSTFQSCTVNASAEKKFSKTAAYIKSIADYIFKHKENQERFKKGSKLDPSKFCISIEDKASFNAYAIPNARKIVFHTASFLEMENDAQVAAVMAHEIAHVTMQHHAVHHPNVPATKESRSIILAKGKALDRVVAHINDIEALNLRFNKLLKNGLKKGIDKNKAKDIMVNLREAINPSSFSSNGAIDSMQGGFVMAKKEFFALLKPNAVKSADAIIRDAEKIVLSMTPHLEEYAKQSKRYKKIMETKVGLREASNWTERQADEVGLEFYRRAGLRGSQFYAMLNKLPMGFAGDSAELIECVDQIMLAIGTNNPDFEPEQGVSSHPEFCWRLYNHQKEKIKHIKDHSKFPNSVVNLSFGDLKEVKDEIREKSIYFSKTGSDGSSSSEATSSDSSEGEEPGYDPGGESGDDDDYYDSGKTSDQGGYENRDSSESSGDEGYGTDNRDYSNGN